MTFTQKLQRAVQTSNSVLSVGLDPDPTRMPDSLKKQFRDPCDVTHEFCRRVIECTKTEVAAYKPNLAFFEALGSGGWKVLESLTELIPHGKMIIADAKRGDIGSTANQYKIAFFDKLQVDAITLNPLMGLDTLDPFLEDKSRGVYVLTLTSNPGSDQFLEKTLHQHFDTTLAEYISRQLYQKNKTSETHLGMVVGATRAATAGNVLQANPHAHLLIPGVGTQGGNINQLIKLLRRHSGIPLINSSRAILYAGEGTENWEEQVALKASETRRLLDPIAKQYLTTDE